MPDSSTDNQQDQEQQRRRDEILALLLGLLTITPGDIDAAADLWEQHSQQSYRGLLLPEKAGPYDFDPQRQLYIRRSTGRAIAPDELKRVSLNFAGGIARDVLEPDAVRVAQQTVPLEKWATQTAQDVKDAAIVMAALAAGGFDKLDDAAKQTIIGEPDKAPGLAFSFERLANFAGDVAELRHDEQGTAAAQGQIVARSGLYAQALNGLFEVISRDSHTNARDPQGRALFLFEKNVLGPNENTHCFECPELTAKGWVSIGTLPAPGLRQCLMQCHCRLAYSLLGAAENEQ